jgi:hypothetical protein
MEKGKKTVISRPDYFSFSIINRRKAQARRLPDRDW